MENANKKSPFITWIDNYWYHYKWRTLLAIFLIIMLTVGCVQCSSRKDYDVEALFYMDAGVPDATVKLIQTELDKFVPDLDANGISECHVANLAYDHSSFKTVDLATAKSSLLANSITDGSIALYIVNEYGYNFLMAENFSLFEKFDFLPDKDSHAWCWENSKLRQTLKEQGVDLPEKMYFCVRRVSGTMAQNDSEAVQAQKAAQDIIKRLMEN